MSRAERMRAAADALAAAILGVLEAVAPDDAATGNVDTTSHDLSVSELCARYQRSPSTVRGWLEAGRFPGAYKLNGRDWRVPPDALAAFQSAQRTQTPVVTAPTPSSQPADLRAWRRVRAPRQPR